MVLAKHGEGYLFGVFMLFVGVFISGRHHSFGALLDACAAGQFPAKISCVVTTTKMEDVAILAKQAGIACLTLSPNDYADGFSFEAAMETAIAPHRVQLICLSDFTHPFSVGFLKRWTDRLVDCHPSLLMDVPRDEACRRDKIAGPAQFGCSVYFMRAIRKDAPVILQLAAEVHAKDTEEEIRDHLRKAADKAYPAALRLMAQGRVNVIDEHVFVVDAQREDPRLIFPRDAS